MRKQPSTISNPAHFPSRSTPFKVAAAVRAVFALLFIFGLAVRGAVPSPEKLLPEDTLVVVTAPDFTKLRDAWKAMPQTGIWDDPAMKSFREHFVERWSEEFVKPLERELSIKMEDYTSLLQGQITFALVQNGWQGEDDKNPGFLLLLDTKDKSPQLKKNLADARKKWIDSGRKLRTEKIRDLEFSVLPMSSNDMPKTLQKFFPPSTEVREIGDENKEKKAPAEDILAVGQVDSLLVIGNSMKVVEKIVVRLTGGSMPSLGETAAFQVNYNSLFRDVPFYGWVNVKTFIDIMVKQAAEKKENGDAPNPFDLKPEKFVGALGFTGLKTLALTLQTATDGSLIRIYVGAPESARQGLLKILAGEAKEVSPPPFIPASVTKLMRWRMDGQKAWTTLQKMLENISPQMVSGLNFVLDSADTRARDKDPGFDIRKNLIGNLGDDIITYQKAPKEATAAAMASPPSLFLLGSQKPEVLLAALRGLLVILPQGESIAEREFLGRKIYSVEVPGLPFAGGGDPRSGGKLHFAAGSAYAAFSTDPGVLEEYLRSSESQAKSLRETPGLSEAIQKVTGPGAELLGYENQAETMRTTFEMLRKGLGPTNSSASAASAVLPNSLNIADSEKTVKGWFDFSLLPAYDKVSKYFYFSVYGATATSDGLTLKFFSPVPPALRAGAASSDAPKK